MVPKGDGMAPNEIPDADALLVADELGIRIFSPMIREAVGESPLELARALSGIPFAAAIDERLSPAVTVWTIPEELVDADADAEEFELSGAEASAAAPSASTGT
jgi:hypothetical protein